ncbi:MAG: patatin-like phospholipase family protein, partial [Phycisphaerae bacterium]
MPNATKSYSNGVIKSIFFQSSRAVFQGGGCRGAALAGAYEAASNCGVKFTEVAGTSAGSIIAALIGANATPPTVKNILMDLDFKTLLGKPEKGDGCKSAFLRTLAYFFYPFKYSSKVAYIRNIILFGGRYSSGPIEVWMNDVLRNLLPHVHGKVQFKDLIIPTRIVATDLSASKAKIWGTKETPDESVAFAVRCSCSIPFVFQAVEHGCNRFVDGGVISNLPAFVYREEDATGQSIANRILAFRFQGEDAQSVEWEPKETASRL